MEAILTVDERVDLSERHEGVTLEQYAELSAAMAVPGADSDHIANRFGLNGDDQWRKIRSAWTKVLSHASNHRYRTQYGALFQKFAKQTFATPLIKRLGGSVTTYEGLDRLALKVSPDASIAFDINEVIDGLESRDRSERWPTARYLAAEYTRMDLVADQAAELPRCMQVLTEIVNCFDDNTVGDAEEAADRLAEMSRDETAQHTIHAGLRRAEQRLLELRRAYDALPPNMPSRFELRILIDDYESLTESLTELLRGW